MISRSSDIAKLAGYLSRRALKALNYFEEPYRGSPIKTIGELLDTSDDDLKRRRGLGKDSLWELRSWIERIKPELLSEELQLLQAEIRAQKTQKTTKRHLPSGNLKTWVRGTWRIDGDAKRANP